MLTTSLLLTVGLLAPTAASAAPSAGAAEGLGTRGSALTDAPSVRASSNGTIVVRDLSFACPKGRVPSAGFSDVPDNYPFAKAIDCLVWYEITQGKTETRYAPNEHVTRRQMAVFIYRMLDDLMFLPEPPARSQFRDVPATGEVGEAINTLASAELAEMLGGERIVAGKTATEFDPAGLVTRAQMGSFIARVLRGVAAYNSATLEQGHCGDPARPDEGCFPDEKLIPTSHRSNVAQLYRFGIVSGRTDGTYGPAANVTRGQMSAFLMRLMDVFVEAKVTVPPDAYAEVYVDRGTAAAACSNTGRDGSSSKPFCTIQAGINAARNIPGYVVDVLVRDRAPYTEAIQLSSGKAFAVDLVPSHDIVDVAGSIQVTGADVQAWNGIFGFDVTAPSGAAIRVTTPGSALVFFGVADGEPAITVNQTGRTGILASEVYGVTTGIDLVSTTLTADDSGTYVGLDTWFAEVTDAYVRAPASGASAGVIDANLKEWRADSEFETATKLGTSNGRKAILPA